MKPISRNFRVCIATMFLIGICLGLRARTVQQARAKQERFGRYTTTQMFERAKTLCELLAPDVDNIQLIADHGTSYYYGHPVYRSWEILCRDNTGKDILYFRWDAESGVLIAASLCNYHTPHPNRPPISDAEAMHGAEYWAAVLGLNRAEECHWLPDLQRTDKAVMICGETTRGRIYVRLNAHSGEFIMAERKMHS